MSGGWKKGHPYEGRWRWWYSSISDWMIRNPGKDLKDCAKELDKHESTISLIVTTDLFKAYHEQRLKEWRERHDFALRDKLTRVAEASLDLMIDKMDKKRDQVPISTLNEITTSALDRLGYAPQKVGVTINAPTQNNTFNAPVSTSVLVEAREALRIVEEKKRGGSMMIDHIPAPPVQDFLEAGPQTDVEDEDAPLSISSE